MSKVKKADRVKGKKPKTEADKTVSKFIKHSDEVSRLKRGEKQDKKIRRKRKSVEGL